VAEHDDFMTVAEIAAILKLNQQTVCNWIDAGKLPALHIGSARSHSSCRLRCARRRQVRPQRVVKLAG
jgi:excisionase family DNA binding protein